MARNGKKKLLKNHPASDYQHSITETMLQLFVLIRFDSCPLNTIPQDGDSKNLKIEYSSTLIFTFSKGPDAIA